MSDQVRTAVMRYAPAEKEGIDLPATCRGGICGACVARLAKGTVDPSDIPDLSFTLSEVSGG